MSNAMAGDAMLAGVRSASPRRWIESAPFDLFLLTLPPLLLLPIGIALENHVYRVMTIGILLAFPHYFSSLAFYFWDDRRNYYRQRWLAFYGGPVILGVVLLLMIFLKVPLIIQVILFFWNTYHVARQNCGILSIYRHGAGVHDMRHRNAANLAIISVSTALALWNISTHLEVWPILNVHPKLPAVVWTAAGTIAILAVGRLVWSIVDRVREGKGPALPEAAFLASSVLMFHPYLWMRDSTLATFVMLLPHYVQYMGFLWLLHRRKFREVSGSRRQIIVSKLSSDIRYLLPVLFVIGAAFWAGSSLSRRFGFFIQYETLGLLIAFLHFYMDGMFWAFRQPEIRSSLAPFLMRRPAASVATS